MFTKEVLEILRGQRLARLEGQLVPGVESPPGEALLRFLTISLGDGRRVRVWGSQDHSKLRLTMYPLTVGAPDPQQAEERPLDLLPPWVKLSHRRIDEVELQGETFTPPPSTLPESTGDEELDAWRTSGEEWMVFLGGQDPKPTFLPSCLTLRLEGGFRVLLRPAPEHPNILSSATLRATVLAPDS